MEEELYLGLCAKDRASRHSEHNAENTRQRLLPMSDLYLERNAKDANQEDGVNRLAELKKTKRRSLGDEKDRKDTESGNNECKPNGDDGASISDGSCNYEDRS